MLPGHLPAGLCRTDVYGGFSYTEDLSLILETVLSLLDVDGAFYTVVQNVDFRG